MFCEFLGHFILLLISPVLFRVSDPGCDNKSPSPEQGADSYEQAIQPEEIETGPQKHDAGSDAAFSYEAPGQSHQSPSAKNGDDHELAQQYESDYWQESDEESDYVHSPDMIPDYDKIYCISFDVDC